MPRHLHIWAALALAALLSGCGSKKTLVNPGFTIPEGIPSSALELITYYDTPSYKIRMLDRGSLGKVNIGTGPNVDTLATDPLTGQFAITPIRNYTPGTVRGLVINRTAAEGVEIFRTEANGAVRRIFEFSLQPTRRWLDGLTEIYEFSDPDPKRAAGATYFARGLIGGVGGGASPISNGSRPTGAPITEIRYLAERWGTEPGTQFFTAESTFYMAWTPVSGASRYLIQVFEYQTRALSLRDRVLTGTPSPVLTLGARDIFVASLPASSTTYRMGGPGATIYTFRTPRLRADYYVRISAMDSEGQMIGMTTGPRITQPSDLGQIYRFPRDETVKDNFADFADPEVAGAAPPAYLLYARGAVWVSPGIDPNLSSPMSRLDRAAGQ